MVTIAGLALAGGLVILGAKLAQAPAATPDLSRPGTAESPRRVAVIMRDYVFNPTPLYLVPGETIELRAFNAGLVAHELVLGNGAVQQAWASAHGAATPPGPFTTPPPARVAPGTGGLELLLQPGESRTVVYRVPAIGSLQLACHLPGHVERGMVGSVILATH